MILKWLNVVSVTVQELLFIPRLKMRNCYKQNNSSKNKKNKIYTHVKKNSGKENGAYERNLKYTRLTTCNKL